MTDLIGPIEREPNKPITLAETDIVKIDGHSVDIPVSVALHLYPFPRVEIESNAFSDLANRRDHLAIELRNSAQLDVRLGALHFNPEKAILIPASQPATVIDKKSALKEVSFAILDFPQFYGQQDKCINNGEQCVRIPQARLETSEWRIDITGVPNIREAEEILKQSRGHGITYEGSIIRLGGETFQANDVEPLLEALRVFLSIARGAACSLALVRGKDQKSQDSWVRWGVHHSEPWLDYHSAVSGVHSNILSDLFPEFWALFLAQEDRGGAMLPALDWYVQSNAIKAPYIGIILTYAALEGLSYLVLDEEEESNPEKTKCRSGGRPIERALRKMQIPLALPKNCKDLRTIKAKWIKGSHALADIRNDLIHPHKDLVGVSTTDHWKAWHLGQWYFELMLLSRLGYQGCYRNRLANTQRNEESIAPVPWAPR